MSRYRSALSAALIGLLAALPLLASASQLPFNTAEAKQQTVTREHVFDGVVEAVNESTVSAQTAGRVEQLNYDVDDFVEEGAVLVRLRDKQQRARYEQAKASLQEARARFQEAQDEFKRIKRIYEKDLVSESEMDKARSQLDAARARLEKAKAALAEAEEQLEYTRVRAPYSGIVTKRHVEVGESVNVGQPLMTGISLEDLRVNVNVPQRLINAVRDQEQARIIYHRGEADVTAESLTFFPYADAKTHTFKVRVNLPKGVEGLFPGMYVKVAMVTGMKQQLVVPVRAVAYRSEVTGVYVVDDKGNVNLRQIRVGRRTEGMMEVLAGLEPGERVALEPVRAALYYKEQEIARQGQQNGGQGVGGSHE